MIGVNGGAIGTPSSKLKGNTKRRGTGERGSKFLDQITRFNP